MTDTHAQAETFGIEAFALDDRLRLFHFTAVDKRTESLWVLRAFDRARSNYVVLLHANDVAAQLAELRDEHPDVPVPNDAAELTPLLDQLHGWQLLDRSFDGTTWVYGHTLASLATEAAWGCSRLPRANCNGLLVSFCGR